MMPRVLILGTGQLGLMLAEAGARLGIVVDRYDPEGHLLVPGTSDLTVPFDTDALLERYTLISTEREHLPQTPELRRLVDQPGCAARLALAQLPDRRSQKRLLDELGLPSAPWRDWQAAGDLEEARRDWGGVVVKSRQGGYDGRGTWLLPPGAQSPPDMRGNAIIEARIAFRRELSLVGARNQQGQCVFLPLVENHHHEGILRLTLAPAANSDPLQGAAEAMLGALMSALDYRGVMTVELFESDAGLLINEIAPRVHNSGHWSQDGATLSQFDLHLHALTGLPLATPRCSGFHAMVNLIGQPFEEHWLQRPGVLHWYNKEPRPGRKLGHVNLQAASREDLDAQLLIWQDQLP